MLVKRKYYLVSILYYNLIYLFFMIVGYINLYNIFKSQMKKFIDMSICINIFIFAFTIDMELVTILCTEINYNNLSNHSFYYLIFKKELIYSFISKLFNEMNIPFYIFYIYKNFNNLMYFHICIQICRK